MCVPNQAIDINLADFNFNSLTQQASIESYIYNITLR